MGFRGTFAVHRGQSLLEELLPGIDSILCFDGVSGDWQVTRVFEPRADFLAALRDATGAPVLAAEVIDSDAALVRGLGWRSDFRVWLHPARAKAFADDVSVVDDGDAAVAWAEEAGLLPGETVELTRLLAGEEGPVEARFFALLSL